MMTITLTCPQCGSAVTVYPSKKAQKAQCDICSHQIPLKFNSHHEEGLVYECPCCERKDFYRQKDFNRKLGVLLFIIAAVFSIWTYGISLIVLWLLDLFLFKKLGNVVVCYKCQSIFRRAVNTNDIPDFNHEINDRVVYSDAHFEGKRP